MKVILIPYCFYPDPVAGTEIYVETLAMRLGELGVQVLIAAPGNKNDKYLHKGLLVYRFAISDKIDDLSELYNEGDPASAAEFGKILDEEKPDIVHLHALTRAVSVYVVREAKKRGLTVIFTYHTPTVSCQRGTLMRWGRRVCDGRLDLNLCAICTLHGLGTPLGLAGVIGMVPCGIRDLLGRLKLSGGIWTALRIRESIKIRHAAVSMFMKEVDHIIVLCQWCKELLLRNGVAFEKITISRQGVYQGPGDSNHTQQNLPAKGPIKIAYMGRLSLEKGVEVVIQALKKIPKADIEMHIYGIVQDEKAMRYFLRLKKLIKNDSRILFHPPVPNDKVISLLEGYHYLVVPSIWLETGPLVILEAFLTKVPVIGSDLGGIAELITHGVNGLLVKYGSVWAWREVLLQISKDRDLIAKLRSGISPPRRMRAVALEMKELYNRYYSKNNEYV